MTFDEVLARVIDVLQRQGHVSYQALKRRFDLDDEYLNSPAGTEHRVAYQRGT